MDYKAQEPAEGVVKMKEWPDMKYYKVPCECGCDNSVDFSVEIDEFNITANMSMNTKTKYWRNRLYIDYNENWLVLNLKQTFNDWYNRLDICWKALTKGYIETSADVILSPQQAYNFSETLKTAISEYEVTVEARMAARRESTKDVK